MNAQEGKGFAWGGWILFASVVMVIMGFANIFQGIAALARHTYYVVSGGQLLVLNYTAWGWLLLIWGIILVLMGGSLASRATWARWGAIILVGLNIIAELGYLNANPIWSLIVIALNVTVLFALTAHWQEAKDY